jgi:hypothetical protein
MNTKLASIYSDRQIQSLDYCAVGKVIQWRSQRSALYVTTVLLVLVLKCVSVASAETFFVGPDGNDRRGAGTAKAPWATIGYGISRLSESDTLIVLDGVYSGKANFINSRFTPVPSGKPNRPTTIRAENPLRVRIRNDHQLKYYENMLLLDKGASHIMVDGFIFDMLDTAYPPFVAEVNGDFNTVSRVIVRRKGMADEHGGWIAIGGSDNLVEDCAGTGAARYGFFTGGPKSKAQRNIFRRCVGRFDFSAARQPKATFAIYGNDNGHDVRDVLLQNCIAIDGQRGPRGAEETYAGFYFPKNATNVTVQGSIALNLEVAFAGYFIRELDGRNIRIEHSIAWNIKGDDAVSGFRFNGRSSESVHLDHVTVGATRFGYYNRDRGMANSLTNSLFLNIEKKSADNEFGFATTSGNAFFEGRTPGILPHQERMGRLKFLPNPAIGIESTASAKSPGAIVMHRYGRAGSRWGETGFNTLTQEPLWPWPYEAEIRDVFAEPNHPSSGNIPATNDTLRGFAAPKDKFGNAESFTRYVWQFLGNAMPGTPYSPSTKLPPK